MDLQINTSLSASISLEQASGRKGEGSSVRPRPNDAADNKHGQSGQSRQINHAPQTNQVSSVSSLTSASNTIIDVQKSGQKSGQNDARHATNAYQAAGAVSGIGLSENTDSNEAEVFSPERASPIDIQA
ncbi:MAG: hypothetical protein KAI27_06270 [Rhodospirillaceae bacterium]|nr:hypothetical protein [Rhodospirillaceae bacterium]